MFRYNVTVGRRHRRARGQPADAGAAERSAGDPRSDDARAARERSASAAGTTGTITDLTNPATQQYFYQSAGTRASSTRRPAASTSTCRPNHRLSGSYSWGASSTSPDILNNNDAPFPGFPVLGQSPSYRTVGSTSLRSTLSSHARQRAARRLAVVAARLLDQRHAAACSTHQGGFGWNFDRRATCSA